MPGRTEIRRVGLENGKRRVLQNARINFLYRRKNTRLSLYPRSAYFVGMLSKKKIAVAIIVLLIAISLGYFYFEGEKVKEEFVYIFERNPQYGKDFSTAVVVPFLTYYMKNNENNPEAVKAMETLCVDDSAACIEAIAPNEELKQACKQAINSIKEMTQKIKNENSIVLGFKRTFFGDNANLYGETTATNDLQECINKIRSAFSI